MEINYSKLVSIDDQALDIEWLEQSRNMLKVTHMSADRRAEMDKVADALDLEFAVLDKKVRANPEKYELDKVTDAIVKNAIVREESYIAAKQEYLNAKYEYDLSKGAVQAMEQKKSALEGLVKLFMNQYFAGPSVPRDLQAELLNKRKEQEQQKTINKGITNKLKRRKTKNEDI
jgi:hypothetical protein